MTWFRRSSTPTITPPRRRRRALVAIGAAVLVAVITALALRDTSPVGHFTSGSGKDEFAAAYAAAMRQLPEPDATIDARTSFGVVRLYRFDGVNPDATPLVLLPGTASGSPVWADNLPGLRGERTVYTVDLLGEPGASIQGRPVESAEEQARWLDEALAGLPHRRFHLVGLSIGGWTATNLAVHAPRRVSSLVLLDPAVTFADLPLETVVRSIPAAVPWLPRAWRDDFASWTAGGAPVEDEPLARMIEAGMRTYAMKLPAPERFSDAQLRSLGMPVLVILAGESVMHEPRDAAAVAERTLREGTVLVYANASHAINGEFADRISRDIHDFLVG